MSTSLRLVLLCLVGSAGCLSGATGTGVDLSIGDDLGPGDDLAGTTQPDLAGDDLGAGDLAMAPIDAASLSAPTRSRGTLSPSFTASIIAYGATVAAFDATVTVTATPIDPAASLTV